MGARPPRPTAPLWTAAQARRGPPLEIKLVELLQELIVALVAIRDGALSPSLTAMRRRDGSISGSALSTLTGCPCETLVVGEQRARMPVGGGQHERVGESQRVVPGAKLCGP